MGEVFNGILALKPSGSAGPDGIPTQFLIPCVFSLCKPIQYLFNLSISSGKFPDFWKTSYLIPIYKSGDKELITNYRGICNQSVLPKLLDRLIAEQLKVVCKQIIVDEQHGFCQGRSTPTNLLIYQNYIVSSLEGGNQVDLVYEDFSKALDRVNHQILIYKLNAMNFDDRFVKWVESFNTTRSQLVKIGKFLSKAVIVKSGVPQGSHYDLKIFRSISSVLDCSLLQSDLLKVENCCKWNDMETNFDKICKCGMVAYVYDPYQKFGKGSKFVSTHLCMEIRRQRLVSR
ncbi:uncharacterized protein LOC135129901 [Zophobas morio]|uniref:uncharacterized protein LOC135129901 n=1 Tax=Zophobas morio TaxID=2755281 RepID=UPI003082E900